MSWQWPSDVPASGAETCTPNSLSLVVIGLVSTAYPDGCRHELTFLLRLRPCPVRGPLLLYPCILMWLWTHVSMLQCYQWLQCLLLVTARKTLDMSVSAWCQKKSFWVRIQISLCFLTVKIYMFNLASYSKSINQQQNRQLHSVKDMLSGNAGERENKHWYEQKWLLTLTSKREFTIL